LHAQHLISLDKILSLSKSLFGGFNLSDIFLAIQNVALRRLSEYFNGNIGAKSNRQVQLILFHHHPLGQIHRRIPKIQRLFVTYCQ